MIIYVGISSHIGSIRGRQDHQLDGNPADVMIAHITDFRHSAADDNKFTLAAYTDSEVIFHTDVGDIVSLFMLNEASTGGQSQLASSWRIYNELAQTRPDLIKVLADNWEIPRYELHAPNDINGNLTVMQRKGGLCRPSTTASVLSTASWPRPGEANHSIFSALFLRVRWPATIEISHRSPGRGAGFSSLSS